MVTASAEPIDSTLTSPSSRSSITVQLDPLLQKWSIAHRRFSSFEKIGLEDFSGSSNQREQFVG